MKFINLTFDAPKERVLEVIKNHDRVNDGVKFDESKGKPAIIVKQKQNRLSVTCKMIGGPTRDNGFFVGTVFLGKMTEKEGRTVIKGIITTSPIYHLGLLLLTCFFIYKCIDLGGFSPIPIILLIFSLLLFKGEFKKQGIIARYLERAKRKIESGEMK